MMQLQFAFFLGLVTCGSAVESGAVGSSVNPMDKVITIVEKLLKTVTTEGVTEDKNYKEFACFCGNKTEDLGKLAEQDNKRIQLTAAKMDKAEAKRTRAGTERLQFKADLEGYHSSVDDYKGRLAEETARFSAVDADFRTNKAGFDGAIDSLSDSLDRINNSATFLQFPGVSEYLALADTMGIITTPKHKAVAASLLQSNGPAKHPMEQYNYHGGSSDIISLLKDLRQQMTWMHGNATSENNKVVSQYKGMLSTLQKKITDTDAQIADREGQVSSSIKDKGRLRRIMVEENDSLKDNEVTLKALTTACEDRAQEFDQRAGMRAEEITALTAALANMKKADKVAIKDRSGDSNLTLIQGKVPKPYVPFKPLPSTGALALVAARRAAATKAVAGKSLSFLQESRAKKHEALFLKKRAELSLEEQEERKSNVIELLSNQGQHLNSLLLTSLAAGAADDPFTKVKDLIEKLITRLEEEASGETTKKGFCDTKLAKAETERDFRLQEAKALNVELERLEANKEGLEESIKRDDAKIDETKDALSETTGFSSDLKEQQQEALAEQQHGLEQIQEALLTLRAFYSAAARSTSPGLLQKTQQPSDSDELSPEEIAELKKRKARNQELGARDSRRGDIRDTAAEGAQGVYAGQQNTMHSVFSLLETIQSDFEREIRALENGLGINRAQKAEATQALSSQNRGAEEQKELDLQELASTKIAIEVNHNDLKNTVALLDASLKELTQLQPMCVDSGMSYKDRVDKRQKEIDALNKALGILK